MTTSVGLVGCGRWGRLILRDLVALGATVHVVVADPRDEEGVLALGAATVTVGIDALPEVDGVVVATPASVHADSIEQALPLEVPIFVEKPFTTDPSRARALAAAAPGRIFVMDKWRYHPGVRALRDAVASARLGEIRELRTIRVQAGMPHTDVDCTWVLLPHDLSIALEVMGRYPSLVQARGRTVDGDLNHVTAELRFDAGATMHVEAGIDATAAERRITVVGTRATAVLAGGWDEVITITEHGSGSAGGADDDVRVEHVRTVGELPLLAELRAFLAHLDGGPAPVTSADDGAGSVELIAEIRSLALAGG